MSAVLSWIGNRFGKVGHCSCTVRHVFSSRKELFNYQNRTTNRTIQNNFD